MLIGENLSFSIDGQQLFSNINFNIEPQKDLLITGPSGIGKTTLSFRKNSFPWSQRKNNSQTIKIYDYQN